MMVLVFILVTVVKVSVAQSCPTLCDPMDYSPPGSPVHGVLQARILEWVACPPPGRVTKYEDGCLKMSLSPVCFGWSLQKGEFAELSVSRGPRQILFVILL